MKKAVFILIILTVISKVSGFLRDVTLAYFYGASAVSDVFLISLTIPTVVFGVVAAGISTGYIPMYSRLENEYGEKHSLKYTNNLINILLLFCTLLVVLVLVFTEGVVKVFASGFTGETLELAIVFVRITVVGIYFTMVIRILSAYLNYKKFFAVPSLIGMPMNFILIGAIAWSFYTDQAILLAYGSVAALLVQLLILLVFAYRKGYQYELVFQPKDESMKKMLYIAIPVILGSGVTQINKLVDRSLASQISVGGISSLNYANTLNGAILGIFVASISTVLYPSISRMAAKEDMKGLKHALNQAVTGVALFVIPITGTALLFSDQIVQFLFGRGAFGEEAAVMTAAAFFFYSIGMIGSGLKVLLSRAFYSLQDTKTPMINSAIAMGLNIVLNFLLAPLMGVGGLALATSIASIFTAILLFFSLQKKIGSLQFAGLVQSFLKITGASIVAAFFAWFVHVRLLGIVGESIALIMATGVLFVIYFVLAYITKVESLEETVRAILKKVRRRS